jgi:hypothetical protein
MTENTVAIQWYMLMAAAFGFMIGWTCGEQVCRRQHAEERVDELTEQLDTYLFIPACDSLQFGSRLTSAGIEGHRFRHIRSRNRQPEQRTSAVP